jgi:DNA-binding NarL/FixJ family response regulator
VIRVVIADDYAIVRTGLAQVLEGADDIHLVGVAEDGEQAVRLAAERDADVVLMDLVMPTVGGAEATRRLLSERPGTQVVILTSFSDRERSSTRWRPARSATCSRTPSRMRSWTASGLPRGVSRRWHRRRRGRSSRNVRASGPRSS